MGNHCWLVISGGIIIPAILRILQKNRPSTVRQGLPWGFLPVTTRFSGEHSFMILFGLERLVSRCLQNYVSFWGGLSMKQKVLFFLVQNGNQTGFSSVRVLLPSWPVSLVFQFSGGCPFNLVGSPSHPSTWKNESGSLKKENGEPTRTH